MASKIIFKPLADTKTEKRIQKLLKSHKEQNTVIRGVKAVQKKINSKAKGVVVISGNTTPLDIISHLPSLCENRDIPYVFVKDKSLLRVASIEKNPSTCAFLPEEENEKYQKIKKYLEQRTQVEKNQLF